METGEIAPSNLQARVNTPPADARVIKIDIHDFRFFPSQITVRPGEKLALRIANTDPNPVEHYEFGINLPGGAIGLQNELDAGEFSYLVFNAPTDLGRCAYYSPDSGQKFYGLVGWMQVSEAAK